MGGATKLKAQGLVAEAGTGSPNYALLWELLFTARIFYRYVACAAVLLLSTLGSLMVWSRVGGTSAPHITWLAWGIGIAAVAAETYFNFWNAYLRNANRVLAATRIVMLSYGLRLVVASTLLICGAGLMSLPIASLSTSFLLLVLSRRECLKLLAHCPPPHRVDWKNHLRIIWPNGWRLGLYFASAYLSTSANVFLCSLAFGLKANARYGLSLQAFNIVSGMAAVWTSVKWPVIGQLIARGDLDRLRMVFGPRLCLVIGSFITMAAGIVAIGPPLVHMFSSNKAMLPLGWLILLAASSLFDAHCTAWNTMISLWNRLPMLWPTMATNAVALAINIILVQLPHAQPGWLVLGPFLAGAAFNYWFWPRYGSGLLGFHWLQFMRGSLRRVPSEKCAVRLHG